MLEFGSQAVQDVAERIERAFDLFFSNLKRKVHCSPPKFKKVKRYKSFTLKQAGWKLDEENHILTIKGQGYKYFQSQRISGRIKTVTIKQDGLGDIYVFFVTDAKALEVETRTGKRVGFDFGLKKFLTASDGKNITSPFFFTRSAKLIAKASRELSRKRKGSNNRRRAQLKLARMHKKISDLGFSDFVKILKYEANKFGTVVIEVGRYFASSQLCHSCGYKNEEVKNLKVRKWECPNCGAKHDRDRNAAINILQEGLGQRPMQETP